MESAPTELQQIQHNTILFQTGLQFFESNSSESNAAHLSLELRLLLQSALDNVYHTLDDLKRKCFKEDEKGPLKLRNRFSFALAGNSNIKLLLSRLREAENTLSFVMDISNMYLRAYLKLITTNVSTSYLFDDILFALEHPSHLQKLEHFYKL